jgi:hypothetical protein
MRIQVKSCIVLSIVSLTFSSCSNIFRSQVDGDAFSLAVSFLTATPLKWIYPPDDNSFKPVDELRVMAIYVDGTMRQVPIEMVEIALDGDKVDDIREIPLPKETNTITVSYAAKEAKFVLVVGSGVSTGSGTEEESGGNTLIEIPPFTWE